MAHEVDDARAALKQAEDALKDMQAFTRQNPGASSIEYRQSSTALYHAAKAAFDQVLSQNWRPRWVARRPADQCSRLGRRVAAMRSRGVTG